MTLRRKRKNVSDHHVENMLDNEISVFGAGLCLALY